MRAYSNHASIDRSEVSVLAICETLVAISASVYVIYTFGTFLPLLFSLCAAPLLLLRTKVSISFGLKIFLLAGVLLQPKWVIVVALWLSYIVATVLSLLVAYQFWDVFWALANLIFDGVWRIVFLWWAGPLVLFITFTISSGIICYLVFLIYFAVLFVILLLLKLIATVYGILNSPRDSLIAIPKNWFKIVFCTDICTPPEIFTGIYSDERLKEFFGFIEYFSNLPEEVDDAGSEMDSLIPDGLYGFVSAVVWGIVITLSAISMFLILFLPNLLYRLSLKSTSIAYLPLLYLAEISFLDETPRKVLRRAARQPMSAILAAVTFVSHIALPVLLIFTIGYFDATANQKGITIDLVAYFSFFPNVTLHAMSKALNASLVFLTLWISRWALRSRERLGVSGMRNVDMTIRAVFLIRFFLTLYSIAIFVLIFTRHVDLSDLQHAWEFLRAWLGRITFDFRLFPTH